jgi:hypothetical protein
MIFNISLDKFVARILSLFLAVFRFVTDLQRIGPGWFRLPPRLAEHEDLSPARASRGVRGSMVRASISAPLDSCVRHPPSVEEVLPGHRVAISRRRDNGEPRTGMQGSLAGRRRSSRRERPAARRNRWKARRATARPGRTQASRGRSPAARPRSDRAGQLIEFARFKFWCSIFDHLPDLAAQKPRNCLPRAFPAGRRNLEPQQDGGPRDRIPRAFAVRHKAGRHRAGARSGGSGARGIQRRRRHDHGAPAFARGALDAVAAKRGMARSQASG